MLLVTGSEGLIGTPLVIALRKAGFEVRQFDLRRSADEDVCEPDALRRALTGVTGVVHLAAVTRVVWAQKDPWQCYRTNVRALETLARMCIGSPSRPWLISASSREVYGPASLFPVREDSPHRPINAYARSKVKGEEIMAEAKKSGLRANICRFSNVYGAAHDHADRVANAFARAAAFGGRIQVEGPGHTFDFTFVDDVVQGMVRLVLATDAGEYFPPIHFVSGQPTSLEELSAIAVRNARSAVTPSEEAPRSFDVSHFVGDPERARALLGWETETSIEDGFRALRDRHLREHPSTRAG